jgi:outer membrane protein assembly factor BamB
VLVPAGIAFSASSSAISLDAQGTVTAMTSTGVVARLDAASGEQLWQVQLDALTTANALGLDRNGDSVVGGLFQGAESDLVALKLAGQSGAVEWQSRSPGGQVNALVVDASGDPIVTGSVTTPGGTALLVRKLEGASGQTRWDRELFAGVLPSTGRAIALDPRGDVLVAGSTGGPRGTESFSVVKLRRNDGRFVWRRRLADDGGGSGEATAVVVDGRGAVVAAGSIEGRRTGSDFVVVKLSGARGDDATHGPGQARVRLVDGADPFANLDRVQVVLPRLFRTGSEEFRPRTKR